MIDLLSPVHDEADLPVRPASSTEGVTCASGRVQPERSSSGSPNCTNHSNVEHDGTKVDGLGFPAAARQGRQSASSLNDVVQKATEAALLSMQKQHEVTP